MEVVWNKNINTVPFELVDVGHTFTYNGAIYMKATSLYNEDDSLVVNAVNIKNGIVATFCDDDYVAPIVGKFVVD